LDYEEECDARRDDRGGNSIESACALVCGCEIRKGQECDRRALATSLLTVVGEVAPEATRSRSYSQVDWFSSKIDSSPDLDGLDGWAVCESVDDEN
jgi:hypothetical protein